MEGQEDSGDTEHLKRWAASALFQEDGYWIGGGGRWVQTPHFLNPVTITL